MMRAIIFLGFLAIFALSAPVEKKLDIPKFTEEERAELVNIAQNLTGNETEEDMLRAMKTKSPILYDKIMKLQTALEEAYNKLDEKSQIFYKNIMAEAPVLLNKKDEGIIFRLESLEKLKKEYEDLPEESKESIRKNFGFLANIGLYS